MYRYPFSIIICTVYSLYGTPYSVVFLCWWNTHEKFWNYGVYLTRLCTIQCSRYLSRSPKLNLNLLIQKIIPTHTAHRVIKCKPSQVITSLWKKGVGKICSSQTLLLVFLSRPIQATPLGGKLGQILRLSSSSSSLHAKNRVKNFEGAFCAAG